MTALGLYLYQRKAAALGLAGFALCIHALMALPILLLLLGLKAGVRATILGMLVLVASVLAAASMAMLAPHWSPSFLAVMDPGWLEMVRERSQFVFLQLWRWADWKQNILPLLSLVLTLIVLDDARIRALCATALAIGIAGIIVALFAGLIGPIAILLQGQAWRWLWGRTCQSAIGDADGVYAVALRPRRSTVRRVATRGLALHEDRWHVLCGGLPLSLGGSQTCPEKHRSVPAALCACDGCIGHHVGRRSCSADPRVSLAANGTGNRALHFLRSIIGLDGLSVICAFVVGYSTLHSRSIAGPSAIALTLGTITLFAAPAAFVDHRAEGSAPQIAEFADWRAIIPPGANVFVVNLYYSAGFAWFTLQRPSYLTVDQSSGVIFSSATAAEIRRRSEVLRPIEGLDWRLQQRMAHGAKFDAQALPLTKDRLLHICADPGLDFVVAKEDVGLASECAITILGPGTDGISMTASESTPEGPG